MFLQEKKKRKKEKQNSKQNDIILIHGAGKNVTPIRSG